MKQTLGAATRLRRSPRSAGPSLMGVVLSIVLAIGALAACGSDADEGASDRTLTVVTQAAPVSLDPAQDGGTWIAIRSLTNTSLTHKEPNGEIVPGLAESFRYIGEGNTEFELTLRQDVKFSDGTPLNAEAVKKWLEYFADGTSPFVSLMQLESVEVVDEWTVRLHLATPNPAVPEILSDTRNWGSVSSPMSIDDPDYLSTHTAGTGAYVLDPAKTTANSTYTLVPNEHYYDQDEVRYDKVVVNIIASATSALQAIQTGQADVAIGSPDTLEAAKTAGLQVVSAPGTNNGLFIADWSGSRAEPLSDVRVRQALNYTIDREAIVDAVASGSGTVTHQPFTFDGYDPDLEDFYPYDPDKARELIADSGYSSSDLTFKVLSCACLPGADAMLQAIAGDAEKVGITLQIDSAPNANAYVTKRASLEYPIIPDTAAGESMLRYYNLAYAPGEAGINVFGQTDPMLDDLFQQAVRAGDPEPLWQSMSRRITDQAYTAPVFAGSIIYYVSDGVDGVAMSESRPVALAMEWSPK